MEEEIERCPTCRVVEDSKITKEHCPLQELDKKVFYCSICGWIYTYDEDGDLDGLVNINEKLLFPKLRSVVFGLDTRLKGSLKSILDKTREEERLYE